MASRSIKNRPDIKKKHPFIGVLVVVTILIACFAAGGMGVYALGSSWLEELPDYTDASAYNTPRKTEVYASDRTTLLAEFFIENREPVTLDMISPYVLNGTVATEDERYYDHNGIDLWGIGRAFFVNLAGSSREGASTITQQFTRATVLSKEASDISVKRKVREMYISLKLEEMFTKDEILLMYLNTINYGQGAYGIEAAAHTYFSKPASDLTLIEAATLIGIPQSPTYNNPVDNYNSCLQRRNLVLERMLKNEYITQAEYDVAVQEPINLVLEPKTANGIYLYPYFTSHVREVLQKEFSEDQVFKGGLKVYTTIDPAAQAAAENAARNKEATMADDIEVALTAVDPATGYIKAMVGGKDFDAAPFNLATQAKRSCGSSAKTFTLVAALEEGISPTTSISCSARLSLQGWNLENYGGAEYGTRSIAGAFEVSSNTAFARLVTAVTPEKVVEVAHRMGIKSELPVVPAMTLGSVGVSTDEMAGAYATIANGGVRNEVTPIESVIDRNGNEIYEHAQPERALSPEVAYAATNVMKGVITSGTGMEARLANGQPAAGKTGTSEDWNDSYFVGITPNISVAVWLGARTQRQMPESYTATSVFSDFVNNAYGHLPVQDFPKASDPTYKTFSDSKLNIGSGSTNSGSRQPSAPDPEPEPEAPAETPTDTAPIVPNPPDPDPVIPPDPTNPTPGTDPEPPPPVDPPGPVDPPPTVDPPPSSNG